ncbi:MAG: 4Fe-4S dicluster domain-containing protein [Muribaculaceae bacterium]|nr:4Fe-4S dicluster domain-containing protein [Muribaculaceae bacterium]
MKNLKAEILRFTRILVSIVIMALLTGVLTAYGMKLAKFAGVLAKIQFLPAALAFSLATIVCWLIATIIFGRIYCSTACPLGTFQDICARLPRLGHYPSSRNYHYSLPLTAWRNISLLALVVSVFLGVSIIVMLLDPYSIYSRFCVYVLKPVWGVVVNIFSEKSVKMAAASATGITVALILMSIIGYLAARNGRTFCNSICPVGTSLGFISKYSVFRIDINTDKCIECRKCEHVCKASCIDLSSHVVDSSRCVACFDCLPVCPNDAIHYTSNRHQLSIPMLRKVGGTPQLDRRAFLSAGIIMAATPLSAKVNKKRAHLEGGLLNGQQPLSPAVHVTPPGVYDRQNFLDRCTGCGLCISHCMTKVLRPAVGEYGVLRLFHPVKDYDSSYCAFTCTRCTQLCPTGALVPLTREEKVINAVGLAQVSLDRCIGCVKCAEVCPKEAITLSEIPTRGDRKFPTVNPTLCIGCGKCQYVCPARPYKAIIVNGLQ